MGILTLTAEYGSKLTILAEGPDEQAVMDNMTQFFNDQVHEE